MKKNVDPKNDRDKALAKKNIQRITKKHEEVEHDQHGDCQNTLKEIPKKINENDAKLIKSYKNQVTGNRRKSQFVVTKSKMSSL